MTREELSAALDATAPASHGGRPVRPDPALVDACQAFYRSRALDAIAAGPDRHAHFATWVWSHLPRISRLANRLRRERGRRRARLQRRILSLQLALELSP